MSAPCRKCGRTKESLLSTALLKSLGCFVSGPPEDKCAKDWKAHDWPDERKSAPPGLPSDRASPGSLED